MCVTKCSHLSISMMKTAYNYQLEYAIRNVKTREDAHDSRPCGL